MTREKAIECLNYQNETFFGGQSEALKMAISALSTDGEYIKKEDVIEYLNDLFGEMYQVSFSDVLQNIDSLQTYSFPDSAENKGDWIPVSERLPEMGVRVLCACQADLYDVLKLTPEGWFYDTRHTYMFGFVKAWMPLPEPYKADKEVNG